MLKLGITGGIGSGKSTVAKVFALLGVPLYNADDEAKKLMNESVEIRQQLISTFGQHTYNAEGKLNREWMASQVFTNAEMLQKLNAIIHPIVIANGNNWMKNQTGLLAMKEAAIFFESGSAAQMDIIIGVYAPEDIRIQRVMQRDNISRQEVLKRMSRQIKEEIKMRLCDYVIFNNDSKPVIPQVLALHKKLIEMVQFS